ncbi:MAG: glycosyltransferase family 2 protein, partial [Chitinophagales bacterium]|nr:glycosyltransferase family 2 protein [Chitinophagales bacterium]
VILVYNEDKNIFLLLKSLSRLLKNYPSEILIIDNGLSNRVISALEKLRTQLSLRIVKKSNENFNFGIFRNEATRLAKGRLVLFISADVVLPSSKQLFKYLLHDFAVSKQVVAVFAKQKARADSHILTRIELDCRFKELDKYIKNSKQPILIQTLKNPFVNYDNNKFLFSFLSNVFACYRRDYLLKFPFQKTAGFEDVLMGKQIIEQGLTKIYDPRIVITHSHDYSLLEYYSKQKRDYLMRFIRTDLGGGVKIACKAREIWNSDINNFQKIIETFKLILLYFVKVLAILEIKLDLIRKKI